jgi:hypothetical protein
MTKRELRAYLEHKESTMWQPIMWAQVFVTLAVFVVLIWLRGSGDKKSVVGIVRCMDMDWGLLAILIVF